MSVCVVKIHHEACGHKALQVFQKEDGEYDGFCFACGTFVEHPFHDKPEGYIPPKKIKHTPEEIQEAIEEINGYQTLPLPTRKIKLTAMQQFGVKIGVSTVDGVTPYSYHFPMYDNGKLVGFKNGLISKGSDGRKRVWSTGQASGCELFGWRQACESGSKRLYITEGQFDTVALWQMIMKQQAGTQYADMIPAVVSINNGAGNAVKEISKFSKEIKERFQEVILVFDTDEPGQKAAQEVIKHFPTFKSVLLPLKDANECLLKGRSKAAVQACLYRSSVPKNTRIIRASSLVADAKKKPEFGLSTPFPSLTWHTRGMRFGETWYLGAGVKMGKSVIVNKFISHFISEHNLPVFAAKPEEANVNTVQLVAGMLTEKILHDPNIEFDEEAFDRGVAAIGDKLLLLDCYQQLSWDSLKDDIRYAVSVDNVKLVVIDPVSNLTVGMSSGDANTALLEISTELAAMAKDLQFIPMQFCHLKAPLSGDPHEQGGKVLSTQFAGSRAMMRSCHYMLGLEGNKDPSLPEKERNKRILTILEDRTFGTTGKINLQYNTETGNITEICR